VGDDNEPVEQAHQEKARPSHQSAAMISASSTITRTKTRVTDGGPAPWNVRASQRRRRVGQAALGRAERIGGGRPPAAVGREQLTRRRRRAAGFLWRRSARRLPYGDEV